MSVKNLATTICVNYIGPTLRGGMIMVRIVAMSGLLLLSLVAGAAPKKAPPKPAPPVVPLVSVDAALMPYQKLYQELGVPVLWSREGQMIPEIQIVRQVLLRATEEGLKPLYWNPELDEVIQNYSPERSLELETLATAALMKYATDVSNGRVDPGSVAPEIRVEKKAPPFQKVAAIFKNVTGDVAAGLAGLAPQWPEYQNLRAALARLSQLTPEDFPAIQVPRGGVKLNEQNPVISAVKTRLRTLGYQISETGPVYTQELADLVGEYLREQTIPGEATLRNPESAFWKHIAVPLESRIQQIRLTMEKLRWFPTTPESQRIVVNLGFQHFRLFDGEYVKIDMRTINGRSQRKSPMLRDRIVGVELNPGWTVPARLILEDKAPAIMKDPYYLEENNFYITDANGREIPSWQIDWSRLSKRNVDSIEIHQRPGLGNALGIMKFHLTNNFAIYLHDTNERGLFTENHRLLSSGCIRLERPLDLAYELLQNDPRWNQPGSIEQELATSRVADPWIRVKQIINLKQSMPVYLVQMTVEATPGSPVLFANDYYGQDGALFEALRGR